MFKELDLNITVRNLVVTNGNAGGACYNRTTGAMQPESYNCEAEELVSTIRPSVASLFVVVPPVQHARPRN